MIKAIIMISLLIGCARFPYNRLIDESTQYLKESHRGAFKKITHNDEAFHYVSLGNKKKPLVVFIHGSPGSWSSFAHFFKNERLLQDFELLTYSRFGYKKNRGAKVTGSLKEQALIAKILIEKLKAERKVVIVGHSYGGPVATYMAMEYPELVDAIVVVAGSVDPNLEHTKWYQYIAGAWGVRSIIPDMLDVCNREIMQLKSELVKIEGGYKKITQPVYVIHGEQDRLVPKANVEYLKKHIVHDNLEVKMLANTKHFIPWSNPSSIVTGIYHSLKGR